MAFDREKFYKNGPKIEKDDSGKAVAKKAKKEVSSEKPAEEEKDAGMVDLMQRHSTERMGMHHKHEKEVLEHMQKKAKEVESDVKDKPKEDQKSKPKGE